MATLEQTQSELLRLVTLLQQGEEAVIRLIREKIASGTNARRVTGKSKLVTTNNRLDDGVKQESATRPAKSSASLCAPRGSRHTRAMHLCFSLESALQP